MELESVIGTVSAVAGATTELLQAIWKTNGVSEFLSAALGGAMTMAAQRQALRHQANRDEIRRQDEKKALAWAIFFKIKHVCECMAQLAAGVEAAGKRAREEKLPLWNVYSVPAHDPRPITWEPEELAMLVEAKQFDILQRYEEVIAWLSNAEQSTRMYREMRIELLSSVPAEFSGTMGTASLNDDEMRALSPRMVQLSTLADSIRETISEQRPCADKLLLNYAAAMKSISGVSPELEFTPEKESRAAPEAERTQGAT